MDVSDVLRCLFTAPIKDQQGEYVIEIPESELETGNLTVGDSYRIGILETGAGRTTAHTPDTPVSEGEQVVVDIEDIGTQGDGIARVGPGYIVFVPDTEIGDRVTVQIGEVKSNFAVAEIVDA